MKRPVHARNISSRTAAIMIVKLSLADGNNEVKSARCYDTPFRSAGESVKSSVKTTWPIEASKSALSKPVALTWLRLKRKKKKGNFNGIQYQDSHGSTLKRAERVEMEHARLPLDVKFHGNEWNGVASKKFPNQEGGELTRWSGSRQKERRKGRRNAYKESERGPGLGLSAC